MSVDTKGVIVTPSKNIAVMMTAVERAISSLLTFKRRQAFPDLHPHHKIDDEGDSPAKRWSLGVNLELHPGSHAVYARFTWDGRPRQVQIAFNCDCDNVNLGKQSVSLSLGCWGDSPLIMQTLLHALSPFGRPYYDENDCDEIPKAPLVVPRLNVFQALNAGYLRPYDVEYLFEHVGTVPAGEFTDQYIDSDFLGVTPSRIAIFSKISDTQERWAAMESWAAEKHATQPMWELLQASVEA